ncbi:hypothetical protein ABK040_010788 [Willaertia magna]
MKLFQNLVSKRNQKLLSSLHNKNYRNFYFQKYDAADRNVARICALFIIGFGLYKFHKKRKVSRLLKQINNETEWIDSNNLEDQKQFIKLYGRIVCNNVKSNDTKDNLFYYVQIDQYSYSSRMTCDRPYLNKISMREDTPLYIEIYDTSNESEILKIEENWNNNELKGLNKKQIQLPSLDNVSTIQFEDFPSPIIKDNVHLLFSNERIIKNIKPSYLGTMYLGGSMKVLYIKQYATGKVIHYNLKEYKLQNGDNVYLVGTLSEDKKIFIPNIISTYTEKEFINKLTEKKNSYFTEACIFIFGAILGFI